MPPSPSDLPMPPMDHTGGLKDSQYTPEMGWVIIGRMADGETIKQIAADPAMPCYATIYHWRKLHAEFAYAWESVRMLQAYHRVERWAARPAQTRPGGKVSSFTEARGEAVCAHLREGVPMSAIHALPGMPSVKVVYTWLKREPRFRQMVAEAREEALSWLAFKIELAVEKGMPTLGPDGSLRMPMESRAVVKAEMTHLAGRIGLLTPKVYGRFKL